MVDRELSQLYGKHVCHATREVLLEVKGLTLRHPRPHQAKVRDIDFTLHKGEVLGFFGLIGAGRTEIMEMIFGMRPFSGDRRGGGPAGRDRRACRRDRPRHRLRHGGSQGAGAGAGHECSRELQPDASRSLLAPLLREPPEGDGAVPRLRPVPRHQDALDGATGRQSQRRQPAEDRHRQVGRPVAEDPHRRRSRRVASTSARKPRCTRSWHGSPPTVWASSSFRRICPKSWRSATA